MKQDNGKKFILPLQSPSSFNKGDPRQVEYFNLVIPVLDNPGGFQLDIGPVFWKKGRPLQTNLSAFEKILGPGTIRSKRRPSSPSHLSGKSFGMVS